MLSASKVSRALMSRATYVIDAESRPPPRNRIRDGSALASCSDLPHTPFTPNDGAASRQISGEHVREVEPLCTLLRLAANDPIDDDVVCASSDAAHAQRIATETAMCLAAMVILPLV
jgi:hypothetical protein